MIWPPLWRSFLACGFGLKSLAQLLVTALELIVFLLQAREFLFHLGKTTFAVTAACQLIEDSEQSLVEARLFEWRIASAFIPISACAFTRRLKPSASKFTPLTQ